MNKQTDKLKSMKMIPSGFNKIFYTCMFISLLVITWACTGNDKTSTTTTTTGIDNTNVKSTDTSSNNNNDAISGNAADADFLMKAAEINLEEIKLGQLAQQKGTISHVKELGKMMVDEHTKAMEELMTLAKTKMVTIPTEPGAKAMDAYNMLKAKPGKDFDKAYSDMMVNGHKDAIALFEKTSASAKDADIKGWASQTLPALRTHLDHSMMCQKECNKM